MNKQVSGKSMAELMDSSFLDGANALYLEQLYEQYLSDAGSVDERWRAYFDELVAQLDGGTDVAHSAIRQAFQNPPRYAGTASQPSAHELLLQEKQLQVAQLIQAYRAHGHKQAATNPLQLEAPATVAELSPEHYGLSEADLQQTFDTGMLGGVERANLAEIIEILQNTYTHSIGSEFLHVAEPEEMNWLQERIELYRGHAACTVEQQRRLLDRLTAAEGLERFLHTKYVGQKRFSLEGADSLIPLLDILIQRAGATEVKELVIGMAHRGRLNVLINILGKTPADLFQEFEGTAADDNGGTGDVKYHKGFSSNIRTPGGMIHTSLLFNPSHLEIVGPVVEGSVRARQDRRDDPEGRTVIPVIIHGDAAFAGQGVVMETFNMSQSRGYNTKGTVHVVVNNQIGFTTSNQLDSRSTMYSTDVAKMVNAPIFHVNGDDPEAVLFVTEMALDYRMRFNKDVVIDLVCYRRQGHSEADEPMATQPGMYRQIRQKRTTRDLYAQHLIAKGVLEEHTPKDILKDYRGVLESGRCAVAEVQTDQPPPFNDWSRFTVQSCNVVLDTGVEKGLLQEMAQELHTVEEGFKLHPAVDKIYQTRLQMGAGEQEMDWGFAETMAYASLLQEGYHVRLSGQDCGRGTFFHRHAVIYDQNTCEPTIPLRKLSHSRSRFLVINSLLSEEAVLGFEYGYSTTEPNTLTIWEAQFGDFANNAQVVIDQFISAGEQKWKRLCGLVMLLPHGLEGQGPEHSSARLERYLQLCAQHNIQVIVPTTPAQIFHALRRQMMLTCRKPLVVMSPKSLLRHKLATSTIDELTEGTFKPILPEFDELDDEQVERVVLCSGKVYYDLLERRRELGREDVAIIRMEQLYPFPSTMLKMQLGRYPKAGTLVWCQEEPMNQGSWFTSQHHVRALMEEGQTLHYAGRPFSAAPAVGKLSLHNEQQRQLVAEAIGEESNNS